VTVRESDGPPEGRGITVGTTASVPDAGPRELDLVGVLDADRMLRRPGLSGPERVVATWFEAAAWARPRPGGRVILETGEPGDPAVQALVRNEPWLFLKADSDRRAAAGFPPGYPVFRVVGTAAVAAGIAELAPANLLVSEAGDERVCLVTVSPDALDAFVARIREWARTGEVRRVEAEPHL
jgi:primosomal protein N' (replication factor Y)